MAIAAPDPALDAYEALAPFYDRYTGNWGYDAWVANLLAIAGGHGLLGDRVLDLACGTGNSFRPMLERGYEVTACDLSPAMVDVARASVGDEAARVLVADLRDLPELGRFDLATALSDALNYVTEERELAAAFAGVARNLRPGGIFIFDLNTLRTYRECFSRDDAFELDGAFFCWRGKGDPDPRPGARAAADIEVFSTTDGECWRRTTSRHVQRHHPPELVGRLLAESGFELLERRGQVLGDRIDPVGDEERHVKLVYVARRRAGVSALSRGRGEVILS